MDTGTYVTHKIKDSLSLPVIHQRNLSIKTFGSYEGDDRTCDVVSIGMKTIDGESIILSLLSVPFICEDLSNHNLPLLV